MPVEIDPGQVKVLVLYNLDPSWKSVEKEEVIAVTSELGRAMSDLGYLVTLVAWSRVDLPTCLSSCEPTSHLVFNWCESVPGLPHSESLVARNLEELGFTFTGAGSAALKLAKEKHRVKAILNRCNIPTPQWRLFHRAAAEGWDRFPAIVKPVHEHCSEGITPDSVVMTEEELEQRISFVLEEYLQPALVEDFIDGREFHVSLWGNGHIELLPPAEMDFSLFSDIRDRLCTYDSKCVPGSAHYQGIKTLLPAPLSQEELQTLEKVCQAAYAAAGCRDYGRIDIRLRDGQFHVLDVNPNADISPDASLACAAELSGYSYGETGSRIVRLALRRHPVWGDHGHRLLKKQV